MPWFGNIFSISKEIRLILSTSLFTSFGVGALCDLGGLSGVRILLSFCPSRLFDEGSTFGLVLFSSEVIFFRHFDVGSVASSSLLSDITIGRVT